MKIRSDFVTNSSSAVYVVEFQIKNDRNGMVFYSMHTNDLATYYDGDSTMWEPFVAEEHAKSLDIWTPNEGHDGQIYLEGQELSNIETLHELLRCMLAQVRIRLFSGGSARTSSIMPLAIDALEERCAEQGITRKNVLIIGEKVHVMPWGDSLYETEEYIEEWDINVKAHELRKSTRYRDGWNGLRWDTRWQDTVWWPVKGGDHGVPYRFVASNVEARRGITELDLSGLDGSQTLSMKALFKGFESLESLDVSGLDTSHAGNMGEMFHSCKRLRNLDLSGFDTSRVTSMSRMFYGCTLLRTLDVSGWDTSHVTLMKEMFAECRCLRSIDLTSWDTSQVTDMSKMFSGCVRLNSVNLSGLSNRHVTDMSSMFERCLSLTQVNLAGFGTSNVRSMQLMFRGCRSLKEISLWGLDTANVRDIGSLFSGCTNLESADLSGCDFSHTNRVHGVFGDCTHLKHWAVSASYPVQSEGTIPTPTNRNGRWWSERAGTWMTPQEIHERGPVADSYWSEGVPTGGRKRRRR